jgi:hypothetical protein
MPVYDPLVAALAQLVRDRWAAEQADREKPVALARIHRSSRCRGQLMAETRLRATERDRRDAGVPA